jgi:hypothetical protein
MTFPLNSCLSPHRVGSDRFVIRAPEHQGSAHRRAPPWGEEGAASGRRREGEERGIGRGSCNGRPRLEFSYRFSGDDPDR